MEQPDDDVARQNDQRHNSTINNSVAGFNRGRVASVNSFALPNGVGDINRKDTIKK